MNNLTEQEREAYVQKHMAMFKEVYDENERLRTQLQAANERIERLRKALTHLINKAHAVTRIERHGMHVSLERIRQLYDAQLKAEEIEKETP